MVISRSSVDISAILSTQRVVENAGVLSTDNSPVKLWLMPSKWQYWHREVCLQVNINPSLSVQKQPLPRPWFLLPSDKPELTETKAEDLIRAVSEYVMQSPDEPVGRIRDRLEKLTPDTSLPFLYSMRYIGYARAQQHRYWPEFRDALFGNRLTYKQVANGLAETTANLWWNLYEWTGQALYFPSAGSVNIKWPLAHAGLHSDDKTVLRAFGLSLCQEDESLLGYVAGAEVDEFIDRFREWLQGNGKHRASMIAEQLLNNDDETALRAELAQQWLKLKLSEIADLAREFEPVQPRSITLRRALTYQSASNNVGITFSSTRPLRHQQIAIEWNGQIFQFITTTIQSTGEQVLRDMFVPVYDSQWSSQAVLHVDCATYPVLLPTIKNEETLVFSMESGERTRRWQFDQTYYLLVHKARFWPDVATRLFSQWHELSPPKDNWENEYRLVWVRTIRMPSDQSASDAGKSVAKQLQELDDITFKMGLPSLRSYYQPHGRLVGQQLAQYGDSVIPIFGVSDPPLLELQGIWGNDVHVTLRRRDSQMGQLQIEGYLSVSASLAGKVPLIELWENEPSVGTYSIAIEQEQIDLCLVDKSASSGGEQPVLRIQGYFATEDDTTIERASRYAFDELSLAVNAWPSVTLRLELHHQTTHRQKELTIQLNELGKWVAPLSYLPVDWADFSAGELSLQLSWRGLFLGQRLELEDRHHVAASSLQVELTDKGNGHYQLHCIGELRGTGEPFGFSGLLLPNPPWSKEVRTFALDVESGGFFEGSCLLDWQPQWLGIGRRDIASGTFVELLTVQLFPGNCSATGQKEVDLSSVASERVAQHWHSIVPMIASIAHPPDLHHFVQAEPLLSLLDEFNYEQVAGAQWVYATSWSDLPLLQQAASRGQPLVLLRGKPSADGFPAPANCIEIESFSETANLKELRFRFTPPHTNIGGGLTQGANNCFVTRPRQPLRGCGRCQQIMPRDQFEGHIPLSGKGTSCTAREPTFRDYSPGSDFDDRVVIGVYADPRSQFDAVINDVQRILKDESKPSTGNQMVFRKLQACVPANCERKKWLQGLSDALTSVIGVLFCNRQLTLREVADCGHILAGYEDAVRIVLAEIVPGSKKQLSLGVAGVGGIRCN